MCISFAMLIVILVLNTKTIVTATPFPFIFFWYANFVYHWNHSSRNIIVLSKSIVNIDNFSNDIAVFIANKFYGTRIGVVPQ